MSIIGTLPYIIQPNTLGDATQVEGNFAFIVAQVNANAAPTVPTINFGRFAADLGGSNVVLSGTGTQKITLTNVAYDPLSEYHLGTYTASQPGIYWLQWVFTPTTSGAVAVTSYIVVNGAFPGVASEVASTADTSIRLQLSRMVSLNALDTVEFYAQRDSTPNSVSGAIYATYGSVTRIA